MSYGLKFLKQKDLFANARQKTDHYEDKTNKQKKIGYIVDPDNKVAYFDKFQRENIPSILRSFIQQKNLKYFWFWKENWLYVHRSYGDCRHFLYELENDKLDDLWIAEKKEKLTELTPDSLNILFHTRAVVDRFYTNLWEIRIAISQAIENEIRDREKILLAQRIIDKLIFIYFLIEKRIITFLNTDGTRNAIQPSDLFYILTDNFQGANQFYQTLNEITINLLNNKQQNAYKIPLKKSNIKIFVPFLNAMFFRERRIEAQDRDNIAESSIKFREDFDWNILIDEFSKYNWILDEYSLIERPETIGNLTPEILGHIFEKFVITMSRLKQVEIHTLRTSESGDLLEGNKKVGAYYTQRDLAHFIARRTLFGSVKARLKLEDYKSFEEFYEHEKNDSSALCHFKEELLNLKILDPSVGSGHFLVSAAEIILDWSKKCSAEFEVDKLKRKILENNLYGVDILSGAVEICQLRLWLWLLSSYYRDSEIKAFSDICLHVVEGNALIGFYRNGSRTLFFNKKKRRIFWKGASKKSNSGTSDLKNLTEMYTESQEYFDKEYVAGLPKMEFLVNGIGEIVSELHSCEDSRFIIKLKWNVAMDEGLKVKLEDAGFRTWKKSAAVSLERGMKDGLHKMESFLREGLSEQDRSKIDSLFIKRTPIPRDLRDLKAFHWTLEFPDIIIDQGGFDVIVGNPPHGNLLEGFEKKMVKKKFRTNTDNITKVFIERAFCIAKPNCTVGLVVPKSMSYYLSWADIRRRILEHHILSDVLDVGIGFIGADSEQLALVLKSTGRKEQDGNSTERSKGIRDQRKNKHQKLLAHNKVRIYVAHPLKRPAPVKRIEYAGSVGQALMKRHNTIIFRPINEIEQNIIEAIHVNTVAFREIYKERAFRGLYIPDANKKRLKPGKILYIDNEPDIHRYSITSVRKIQLHKPKWQKKAEKILVPKLIFKVLRGNRIVCYPDHEGIYLTPTNVVNVTFSGEEQKLVYPLALLCNSPLVSFYVQKMIFSETTESARHWDDPYVGELPIPRAENIPILPLTHICRALKDLNGASQIGLEDPERINFLRRVGQGIAYELYLDGSLDTNLVALIPDQLALDEEIPSTEIFTLLHSNEAVRREINRIETSPLVQEINSFFER